MFTSNFTMLLLLFIWDFLVTLATIHEYELQPKSFAIKSNQINWMNLHITMTNYQQMNALKRCGLRCIKHLTIGHFCEASSLFLLCVRAYLCVSEWVNQNFEFPIKMICQTDVRGFRLKLIWFMEFWLPLFFFARFISIFVQLFDEPFFCFLSFSSLSAIIVSV